MAAAGGVEPMGARLKPAWLKQFSPKAVERCMIATRIFAMPWLVGNQGKDDWVLISFALSLHKPQAVELMKFLATDPATLKEMSKVTGLRAARQGF